ncbi:hypothetical protein LshimejAT787_1802410 [Lyophyllum shimeji]|uniref:Uncharacterized protein n=1 Tax=Lyophyllum shimeji TaxID=47721 RepID=A0A9P3URB7_LYOSH|nr:hypothetical protein LshimejAT787_1802410 [Lyophyllum shimeji]
MVYGSRNPPHARMAVARVDVHLIDRNLHAYILKLRYRTRLRTLPAFFSLQYIVFAVPKHAMFFEADSPHLPPRRNCKWRAKLTRSLSQDTSYSGTLALVLPVLDEIPSSSACAMRHRLQEVFGGEHLKGPPLCLA